MDLSRLIDGYGVALTAYALYGTKRVIKRKIFTRRHCYTLDFVSQQLVEKESSSCDKRDYIHNWPLQPFSQDYDLASHTTHVVCVILYYTYTILYIIQDKGPTI